VADIAGPPGALDEVAGQEPGGAGLPDDLVDRATLTTYDRAPVGTVQVGDIEQQNLLGAGRGLLQQRPGCVPQCQGPGVSADRRSRSGSGPWSGRVAASCAPARRSGRWCPVLGAPVGTGRTQAVEVAVPRRCSGRAPSLGEPVSQLGGHRWVVKHADRVGAGQRCAQQVGRQYRGVGTARPGLFGPAEGVQERRDRGLECHCLGGGGQSVHRRHDPLCVYRAKTRCVAVAQVFCWLG
jgi:hypothetical protein